MFKSALGNICVCKQWVCSVAQLLTRVPFQGCCHELVSLCRAWTISFQLHSTPFLFLCFILIFLMWYLYYTGFSVSEACYFWSGIGVTAKNYFQKVGTRIWLKLELSLYILLWFSFLFFTFCLYLKRDKVLGIGIKYERALNIYTKEFYA